MGEARRFKFDTQIEHAEYQNMHDRLLPNGMWLRSCDLIKFG